MCNWSLYNKRNEHFDYHGIDNVTSRRTTIKNENNKWNGKCFTPKRIVVFQMGQTNIIVTYLLAKIYTQIVESQ